MTKYIVASSSEILPGERKIVLVAGRSLGIFNIGGRFFALLNSCPHQGAPLCSGKLTGLLTAKTPGQYTYTRRGEIIRCPWHGWEFDVVTGKSFVNPLRIRTRRFRVMIEEFSRYSSGDNPSGCGWETPSAIAEIYPVTLDEHFLFVEL